MPEESRKNFYEGQVSGFELNSLNGRRYNYAGHFLGDGTIIYRATVSLPDGERRGELSGVFDHVDEAVNPKEQVDALIKAAIREGVGYRS